MAVRVDVRPRGTSRDGLRLEKTHHALIYDPGFRFRGPPPPPPPNGLGPPRRRERSSRLVCVEASQHALHVYIQYIHTNYTVTYTHTYLQTKTYIHQYMHVHTDTPPPTHRGGAGGRPLVPPTYKNLCTQTLWGGVGGGACRPGPYIGLRTCSRARAGALDGVLSS